MSEPDAVVVGAGPNGLAAALTLALAGRRVLVVEAAERIGGGLRTEELTLPGFLHDVCAAVFPLAVASPFLSSLPLGDHGLSWTHPDLPFAHAIEPGRSALVHRDIDATAAGLGADGDRYRTVARSMARRWPKIADHLLGPVLRLPRHPAASAAFAVRGLPSATTAASRFATTEARAMFAGAAAHSFLPLDRPLTASFGWLLLTIAHTHGWPLVTGGSVAVADAMAAMLRSLGSRIETGRRVDDLRSLPRADITMLDVTPTGFARIAGDRLPRGYLRRVARYRRGPAAFKIDYALSGPVPWADPALAGAGTIHLGGTFEAVADAERAAWEGVSHPDPFLLVVQPTMVDPTRAPEGRHTLWVYGHVPNGSTVDHTDAIERRLERFAPGFRDLVLGRHVLTPEGFERRNPNDVGGDISGGAHTVRQLVFRPFPQPNPYATPIDGVYLCSSATPPGAGVHGMCGHRAARSALG